jgi:hypothetical protein
VRYIRYASVSETRRGVSIESLVIQRESASILTLGGPYQHMMSLLRSVANAGVRLRGSSYSDVCSEA